MKPEEQLMVLSWLDGWTRVKVYSWDNGIKAPKQWIELNDLPNYLSDLNAIHNLFLKLPSGIQWKTVLWLVGFKLPAVVVDFGHYNSALKLARASADEWGAAILKANNLWKD